MECYHNLIQSNMIDKNTESDIKTVKSFLEFWTKFHSIYEETTSRPTIAKEDEDKFIETKLMIRDKYGELGKSLEFKYMPHGRLTDPVSDILNIQTIRFISEENLKRLERNWSDSYVFLNSILERLKNKKRRLGEFNTVGVFFKRIFDRKRGDEL